MKTQRFIHTRTHQTVALPVLGHGFVFSPVPGMKPAIWTVDGLKALGFFMASNHTRWLPPARYPRKLITRTTQRERRGALTY
ncbi:hypothetical protein U2F10_18535 [Leptothoe sp. EHU-05/26/07-4]